MDKICAQCGVVIKVSTKWSVHERQNKKFCSKECKAKSQVGVWIPNGGHFKKGTVPWNRGKTGYLSKEVIAASTERIVNYIHNETQEQKAHRLRGLRNSPPSRGRLGKTGDKDPLWKGEEANYNSKHKWIQKHWVKVGKCEECGKIPVPNPLKRLKHATYWHNPLRTYRRERSEWMEVCAVCHYKLDHK